MKKRQFDESQIVKKITEGSESTIYSYRNPDNTYVIVKLFKDEFVTPTKTEKIPYEVFQNKERKLILLNQSDVIDDDTKPIDLFYIGDKFAGYSMYIDINKDFDYSWSKKEKEEALRELKNTIERLNKNGIYIGDFNIENFRKRDNGSIRLMDIDNFSIGGLPFDRENTLVTDYKKHCSNIKNVDNYGFNYFTLSFYINQTPNTIKRYIKENGLPKRFNTNENKQLIEDLENINDDYTPRFIIDSKKKGLFI